MKKIMHTISLRTVIKIHITIITILILNILIIIIILTVTTIISHHNFNRIIPIIYQHPPFSLFVSL